MSTSIHTNVVSEISKCVYVHVVLFAMCAPLLSSDYRVPLVISLSATTCMYVGMVGAAVNGCIWPGFALLFGEILKVFALPPDQILDEIHLWAGLFIVLGVVSGTAVFFKVCVCVCVCVFE